MALTLATYRGKVSDQSDTVVLEEGAALPPGTEVLVTPVGQVPPRRGSPAAVLRALQAGPEVTAEDVEELLRAIHESQSDVDWQGPFAAQETEDGGERLP
ncbi:MAG: hypothetical protein HY321_08915 [Armatimonadetes bacterium]|nr:hypothetical protein [Armatimonadota bacterium]